MLRHPHKIQHDMKLYLQDMFNIYLPRIEQYVEPQQHPDPLLKPPPHITFLFCWRIELHLVRINKHLVPFGKPRDRQRDLPVPDLGEVCCTEKWVDGSTSHPWQARRGEYRDVLLWGHRHQHPQHTAAAAAMSKNCISIR
jgi:hypothetical protein